MSSPTPGSQPVTFTEVLRGKLHALIEPTVALLARLHVSPNVLTVAGMLGHVLFAWLIVEGRLLLAGILIFIIVPLDALDGALARKLGHSPGFGAFLDSTSDRIAEIILFGGFVIYFWQAAEQWFLIAAYLALAGSLMVSYTRARAEALDLDCKVGLFSRVERYVVIVFCLVINRPEWGMVVLAAGTWITVLQRIVHVWRQFRDR